MPAGAAQSGRRCAIRLSQVDVRFSKSDPPALRDVDFSVDAGQFVAVLGPSGCGKSTLLRVVAGLLPAASGEVLVENGGADQSEPVQGGPPKTAFVFQEPRLLPWRTVFDNVGLPLELQGVSRRDRSEAISESLALVGLSPNDAEKFPRMLSGGMKMRVSLARAMVTRPEVLLLDEPFGALDDMLRQQLNDDLLRLWREHRWTTVFVTHNVSEAVFLSDVIYVMKSAPGEMAARIETPFPHPRSADLRTTAAFARQVGLVSRVLHGGKA